MPTALRLPVLVFIAVALSGVAIAIHDRPLVEQAFVVLGGCWSPSSARMAIGSTVPFDNRYFAGGGEAINPFYRLDVDGHFWEPAPGQVWPVPHHIKTLTLASQNALDVMADDGTVTHYQRSPASVTCDPGVGIAYPIVSPLIWVAEIAAVAMSLVAARFALRRIDEGRLHRS